MRTDFKKSFTSRTFVTESSLMMRRYATLCEIFSASTTTDVGQNALFLRKTEIQSVADGVS